MENAVTGIVRNVDAFAHSGKAKRVWRPTLFHENGVARAWASNRDIIVATTNNAGLLTFKIKFPDGRHCYQPTLAEAEEYAEGAADVH